MGRKWKYLFAALWLFLLSGCGKGKAEPVRVVTRVDVVCDRGYTVHRSCFTDQIQMARILNCLRLRQLRGKADQDPERLAGEAYCIDIYMSDGTHRVCYQRADGYYSEDRHLWQRIGREDAKALRELVLLLEGQKNPPFPRNGGFAVKDGS